jgi:hypothetical protein
MERVRHLGNFIGFCRGIPWGLVVEEKRLLFQLLKSLVEMFLKFFFCCSLPSGPVIEYGTCVNFYRCVSDFRYQFSVYLETGGGTRGPVIRTYTFVVSWLVKFGVRLCEPLNSRKRAPTKQAWSHGREKRMTGSNIPDKPNNLCGMDVSINILRGSSQAPRGCY